MEIENEMHATEIAPIDVTNKFLVGANTDGTILIGNPPREPMTPQEALALAAWLVSLADPAEEMFARTIREVWNA